MMLRFIVLVIDITPLHIDSLLKTNIFKAIPTELSWFHMQMMTWELKFYWLAGCFLNISIWIHFFACNLCRIRSIRVKKKICLKKLYVLLQTIRYHIWLWYWKPVLYSRIFVSLCHLVTLWFRSTACTLHAYASDITWCGILLQAPDSCEIRIWQQLPCPVCRAGPDFSEALGRTGKMGPWTTIVEKMSFFRTRKISLV